MPYQYSGEHTMADIGIEVTAPSVEALFVDSADALTGLMLPELDTLEPRVHEHIELCSTRTGLEPAVEELLFEFLEKLLFFKDARSLLLRATTVQLREKPEGLRLVAALAGDTIDRHRHELGTDVKSITMHRFEAARADGGWKASVVVDV